jgi:hypothetical protein
MHVCFVVSVVKKTRWTARPAGKIVSRCRQLDHGAALLIRRPAATPCVSVSSGIAGSSVLQAAASNGLRSAVKRLQGQ